MFKYWIGKQGRGGGWRKKNKQTKGGSLSLKLNVKYFFSPHPQLFIPDHDFKV